MKRKSSLFKICALILIVCMVVITNFQVFAVSELLSEGSTSENNFEKIEDVISIDKLPSELQENFGIDVSNVVRIDDTDAEILDSVTLINEDDSRTLYVYDNPIKYIEEKTGKIKFVDSSIVETGLIKKMFSNYAYKNASNDFDVFIPKNANKDVLVENQDLDISIRPLTVNNSEGEYKEYEFLGNVEKVIEYKDAFGDGCHLQYNTTGSGIKENIFIDEPCKNNSFQYIIKSPGLIPDRETGDTIGFINEQTKEVVYYLTQTYIRDSYINGIDEKLDNEKHISFDNYYTIETIGKDEYLLTSIIDKDFLESDTTIYPIMVDPTLTVNRGNILSASVFSDNSSRIINNYNTVGKLSGYGQGRSYIKTDTLQNHKYINPENITSAYYKAKEISGNAHSATVQVWDTIFTTATTSVTYSQCLNSLSGTSPKHTIAISNSATYYNIPITSLVKSWLSYELKDGGYTQNYGFVLAIKNGGSVNYKQFGSHLNSSYPPSLVINYKEDTSITAGAYYITNKNSGKALDVSGGSSSSGANIQQYLFNKSRAQQWWIKKISDGIYEIIPAANSNLRLDVSGGANANGQNIQLYGSNSSAAQRWRLIKNKDGTYRIISTLGKLRGIEVVNSSIQDSANVQLNSYNGNSNQRWKFSRINPTIVKRSDWGAGNFKPVDGDTGEIKINNKVISDPTNTDLKEFYNMIVIHHTTRNKNEAMTSLQKAEKASGNADVGYHYVINANGTIYEGRPITKNGAHVGGQNSGKIGIALMGRLHPGVDLNAIPSHPTTQQIESLQELIAWLDYKYRINSVKKHRDLNSNSVCPGDYAVADLANYYIFR